MTLTEEILSLSAAPAGVEADQVRRAREDLALFAEAAARGADIRVARAIRELSARYSEAAPSAARPGEAGQSAANLGEAGHSALAQGAVARSAAGHSATAQGTAGHSAAGHGAAAWAAWAAATAALAGLSEDPAWRGQAYAAWGGQLEDLTVPVSVCAAATALGDDCLAAVAAGTRAASLIAPRLAGADGWPVDAVAATIGATVAAGVMGGLGEEVLRHALGIAATQATGLRAAAGTDAGPLQAGKAAFNAVEAASLAAAGFTSSRDPLEGRRGLLAVLGI